MAGRAGGRGSIAAKPPHPPSPRPGFRSQAGGRMAGALVEERTRSRSSQVRRKEAVASQGSLSGESQSLEVCRKSAVRPGETRTRS